MSAPHDPESVTPRVASGAPTTIIGENVVPLRNRVQWGPILAGVGVAIVTFLLLTILGIALGASVLDPANTAGEIGTWAGIWSAVSAILAFLAGGWVAARTAAVDGPFAGMMNGLLVGVIGLLFIIWLTASGLGNLFGTIGSTVGSVLEVAATAAPAAQEATNLSGQEAGDAVEQATGLDADNPQAAATAIAGEIQAAADQADEAVTAADSPETFEAVRNGAFVTFLGLLLPLLSSSLGGWIGKYRREELIRGTGE